MRAYDLFVAASYGSLLTAAAMLFAEELPVFGDPPMPRTRLTPSEASLVRDKQREAGNYATEAFGDAARLEGERNRLAAENARLRLEVDVLRRGVVWVGEADAAETIPAPKVAFPER